MPTPYSVIPKADGDGPMDLAAGNGVMPNITSTGDEAYFTPDTGNNTPPAGFNLGNAFTDFMNLFPGVANGNLAQASMIPALTSAYNQWKDADRYMDAGREAADRASPITTEDRRAALARYNQIQNDPNGYLNSSPSYQAALRQGIGALERSSASKGFYGDGTMAMGLSQYAGDLAAQHIDKDLNRIRQDAGFQFNPADAASMYMRGVQGSIDARNGALGALMFPFMAQASQNRQPNGGANPNGPRRQGGGSSSGGSGGGGTPAGSASRYIQEAIRRGIQINPNDPIVAQAIQEMTGGQTPWNAGGYMDQWDADGNGEVSWDEYVTGNNEDIMGQLTNDGIIYEPNFGSFEEMPYVEMPNFEEIDFGWLDF